VDKRDYLRIVQVGNATELLQAIRFVTDFNLTFKTIDRKIYAAARHKPVSRENCKPVFRFGPKFFTKLSHMPAVSIEVRESRRQLRKTCYGYRDRFTKERVYLRIDPGSVLEVRDSMCGYLIGTRYLIPKLDGMKSKRWDKVHRLLTRLLKREGIIVSAAHVRKYRDSSKQRVKLTKRILILRDRYLKELRRQLAKRLRDEKAKQ